MVVPGRALAGVAAASAFEERSFLDLPAVTAPASAGPEQELAGVLAASAFEERSFLDLPVVTAPTSAGPEQELAGAVAAPVVGHEVAPSVGCQYNLGLTGGSPMVSSLALGSHLSAQGMAAVKSFPVMPTSRDLTAAALDCHIYLALLVQL